MQFSAFSAKPLCSLRSKMATQYQRARDNLARHRFTGAFGAVMGKSAMPMRMFATDFGSISLLYGPRQIGKTFSLKTFLSHITDCDTVVYTDCSTIMDKQDLYVQVKETISGRTTVVLDEVQEVEGWYLALRSLRSEGLLEQCRVWCTGSEARHLLESGERLPGRIYL